ncbi:MAG: hypothetical protein M3680_18265, partial [Myxococcota bacterium]|nr:hypothetical protein [Myxococcota bacterium]
PTPFGFEVAGTRVGQVPTARDAIMQLAPAPRLAAAAPPVVPPVRWSVLRVAGWALGLFTAGAGLGLAIATFVA